MSHSPEQKRKKEEAKRESEHHMERNVHGEKSEKMYGAYTHKEYPKGEPTEEMKQAERDAYWKMD